MAVISLALQIDSEVYPELHALLSAISNDGSRGERLRQLAASGLVWEAIRIRGLPASLMHPSPAASAAHAPSAHTPPAHSLPPEAPAKHAPAPPNAIAEAPAKAGASAKATEAAGVSPAGRVAVPAAPPLDFIDLALDAPADRGRPAAQPPVLFDVVEPGHIKTPWASAGPASAPAEPPPPPPEVVERPEPTTSRSRLMRMKDKGLFRNG